VKRSVVAEVRSRRETPRHIAALIERLDFAAIDFIDCTPTPV